MLTLVTGSTGLLGNNIVRHLLQRGASVRVLVRESYDRRTLEGLDVDIQIGDVTSPEEVERAFDNVDTVYHSAGLVKIGWGDLEEAKRVNVDGTGYVAAAARERGAKMLHVSTINTLGPGKPDHPINEDSTPTDLIPCSYVTTKTDAEKVVREEIERGLHAVMVLPGFMIGPWDWKPSSGKMVVEVGTRYTPIAPSGGCSVVDVRDVAEGSIAALEKGRVGERYILCGENMTYFELWERICRVAGTSKPRRKMSKLLRKIIGKSGDLIHRLRGREPVVNSAALDMSAQFHYYSSQKAIDELGYQFRDPNIAIQDAWEWFQEHGYVRG